MMRVPGQGMAKAWPRHGQGMAKAPRAAAAMRTAPSASAVRYTGLMKRASSRSCGGERPSRSRGAGSGFAGARPPPVGLACR